MNPIPQEVTLIQMLDARERRVQKQQQLLETYKRPLICFTMNIPGPVKDSPLIRRAFLTGCRALERRLPGHALLHREEHCAVTGCEAMYVLDLDALEVKRICTAIEDETTLGRLFDMDVLNARGEKLDRELVNGKSRDCFVCGLPGRGCASRRTHSVQELQDAASRIMTEYFAGRDARYIGRLAVQSLLDEVCTTPKPGLVDRRNSGSHRDMDIFTFMASSAALAPYFHRCARIGMETASQPPKETFELLRVEGVRAEQDMYEATENVNTHKGAIFTMGLLCGAAGRLWKPEGDWEETVLFAEVAALAAESVKKEQNALREMQSASQGSLPANSKASLAEEEAPTQPAALTTGQRLYLQRGIGGVREEAARGLPSVSAIGLPAYRAYLRKGLDKNRAGSLAFLHLIAQVEDTNMIARGGSDGAAAGAAWAAALLECPEQNEDTEKFPSLGDMEALDDRFIEKNLSPGGCADLLAAVYFTHALLQGREDCESGSPDEVSAEY